MLSVLRSQLAVVDDHPLFRTGLVAVLRDEADLWVVGQAGNADEARSLVRGVELDLAIVDFLMPTTSGLSVAAELREHQPSCRVLALSVIDEPCVIADMLRIGASGFALKTQPIEEILAAIRQVLGGIGYLPPRVSRDAINSELMRARCHALAQLTSRERDVFELMIRGFGNSDIAAHLNITLRTVETHRQRLQRKLCAHSIAQIQRIGAVHGWHG